MTKNGFVYAWGINFNGQLGLGDFKDRSEPTLISSLLETRVNKIAAGHSHSGCINDSGMLYTWGANPDARLFRQIQYYQLSLKPKSINKPHLVTGGDMDGETFIDVSMGASQSAAVTINGVVYTAGPPDYGQLGYKYFDPKTAREPYIQIKSLMREHDECYKVACGDMFTVFLTKKGHIYSCGINSYGRLGQGHKHNMAKPEEIDWF